MDTIEKNLELLVNGAQQVLPAQELLKKLKNGKKLKIKLGMDPTSPDLHLGHAVVLQKMRDFQELGHDIIFLIGDFTAMIGDPTGKSKTRPPLTNEEIQKNTQTYFEQVSKILDPKKVTVRYNSEWLSKLTAKDMVQICAQTTLAQLIEREDFATRLQNQQPIGMHELLYPLFQGYDSVELHADVELGGTDQTFNLIMGRHLQEKYGQEAQVIITMPILEGLDGVQKMSKSLGNAVGLTETPENAYGKLMSIPDTIVSKYYKLLLNKTADNNLSPINIKKHMAYEILKKFWSETDANIGQEYFENIFQKKEYSAAQEVILPADTANPIWIVDLLRLLDAIKTSSEAKRLIEEKAVRINDDIISDFKAQIECKPGMIIKVGKHRIYKIG
ncbi:MAG: tyrosine--tRNA ligase [Candidatus Babeliales bacterium]|nr:tyrosine--tRNA ligase [Candidatus Babeliales bacterium]